MVEEEECLQRRGVLQVLAHNGGTLQNLALAACSHRQGGGQASGGARARVSNSGPHQQQLE